LTPAGKAVENPGAKLWIIGGLFEQVFYPQLTHSQPGPHGTSAKRFKRLILLRKSLK
jgi:hypothetical protein